MNRPSLSPPTTAQIDEPRHAPGPTISLSGQIDHIDAAIIGTEHGLEINRGRKRPDDLDGIREMRLNGFRAVRNTLVWLRDNEANVKVFVAERKAAA